MGRLMTMNMRTARLAVVAAIATATLSAVPAYAVGPPPSAPSSPIQSVGVSTANGDVDVGAAVEPGKAVDAILAFLNALGLTGANVAVSPGGILPATNAGVSATGSVSVSATVASCPADHICFWDKANFSGQKLVLGSPYAQSGGQRCANLPAGFHPLSVITHLRNDRQIAGSNGPVGSTQYNIGLHDARCGAVLPLPDAELAPNDSRASLPPTPGVVSYADPPILVRHFHDCYVNSC